ncbi:MULTISPECIES: ACT domain-containing protein [unclassified Marinobacter]|uniref:ACT domain-containing protein n=1 Tax=unclassified Marinobacter TaxID=83889 RepID=UPI000BF645D7|nr:MULTISPECIES: ACT domain-containing protein [unclassified Marinobacter]PFG10744.1 hypothetical protein ATI45_3221 [Marinobacter sp. LV10MA510-1]PFG52638.1 hypothetical protein ATG98_1689 [Marinobacter sp. LV10R520-4]
MDGTVELESLLSSLVPQMPEVDYVFCSVPGTLGDYAGLEPVTTVRETEGLTLVLPVAVAVRENFRFNGTYRQITLTVHSSLEAVGLTAAISSELASNDIPANVVAGYYHDHIYVPSGKAEKALHLLQALSINSAVVK